MAYSFELRSRSAAPPDVVFRVLADVPRWREWAGPFVRRSSFEREGTPAPGGVGAIRRLGAPPLFAREEIVAFDPPHGLSYVLRSGMPLREYRADVSLTASASGEGTDIVWRGTLTPRFPGTGAALRAFLVFTVGRLARGLAPYAERSR